MTWQVVVVIGLVFASIWILLGTMVVMSRNETQKHLADTRVELGKMQYNIQNVHNEQRSPVAQRPSPSSTAT